MTDSQPTIPVNTSRFVPLPSASQGGRLRVLYYDSTASEIDILDCATCRLNAALGLNEALKDWDNPPAYVIKHMCISSHLLINDAMFLIAEVQKGIFNTMKK